MNNNGDGIDPRSYLSNNFNQSVGHHVAANFANTSDSVPLNLHHAVGSAQSPPPGVDPQMFLSLMQHRGRQFLNANASANSSVRDGNLPLNLRHSGISGDSNTDMDDRYAANFSALFGGYSMSGSSGVSSSAGQQRSTSTQRMMDDRSHNFSPHSFSPGPSNSSTQMQAAALSAAQRSFSPSGYQSSVFSGTDYLYEHGQARQTTTNRDPVSRSRALERQTFSPPAENLTQTAQMQSVARSKTGTTASYRTNIELSAQGNYVSSPPPTQVDTSRNRYSSPAPESFPPVSGSSSRIQLLPQRGRTPVVYPTEEHDSNISKLERRSDLKVDQNKGLSNDMVRFESGISNQKAGGNDSASVTPATERTSTPISTEKTRNLLLSMPDMSTLSAEDLAEDSIDKSYELPSGSLNERAISDDSDVIDNGNSMKESGVSSEICACPVCDMQLGDVESMKEHMLAVHNVQSVAPEAPEDSKTSQVDEATSDVKPVVNNAKFDVFSVPENIFTKFSCVDCGAEFKSKDKLIVHVRKHTGQDTLLCTICGKSFFKTDKLARHMLVHSGERPYICRHCGATFTRSDKLRGHLKSRHDDLSYTCRICRESFDDVLALKLHLSKRTCRAYRPTVSEEEERIRKERELLENAFNEITSQIGDPEMDISMMLNRDKLVAKFEETLKVGGTLDPAALVEEVVGDYGTSGCDDEGSGAVPTVGLFADEAARLEAEKIRARTTHRKNLERIIKKINKHRTVECPQCHLRLPGAYTLTRHMRIAHSIIKTYQYKKKDKSAGNTTPKPRPPPKPSIIKLCQCPVCGKSFTKIDTLRRHEVTHSGERAFKCRYCDAKYSRSDRLRKHLRSAHVQAAYPCIKCDEAFDNRQDLRKHISIHRVRPPKVVVERPRIRGPYKKRKSKTENNEDSSNVSESKMNAYPSSSAGIDSVASMGSGRFVPTSSVDAINSSSEFAQQSFNDGNCSASLMTIEQLSDGENVFRLSSEQLSNALSLRNHLKSAFHMNKARNTLPEKPVPLNVPSEVLADTENAKTASSICMDGSIKARRRYAKKQEVGDFPCSFCGKVFNNPHSVRKHELRHHSDKIRTVKEKKYECQRCGGRFARFETLHAHSKSMHSVILFYCKACDAVFDDEVEWSDHINEKHNGILVSAEVAAAAIFTCKLCRKVCDDRAALRRHLRMHQKKTSRRVSDEEESASSSQEEEAEDEVKQSGLESDVRFKDAQLSMCAAHEVSVHVVGRFKRGRKPASHYVSMAQNNVNIKEEPGVSATVDEDYDDNAENDVVPETEVKQEMLDSSYPDYSDCADEAVRISKVKMMKRRRRRNQIEDDTGIVCNKKEGENLSDSDTISLDSSDFGERDQLIADDLLDCTHCDQQFSDEQSLQKHVTAKHGSKRLILKLKGRLSSKTSAVDLRGKVGRVGSRPCCKICGKQFKNISKLRQHVLRHDEDKYKVAPQQDRYRKQAVLEERVDESERGSESGARKWERMEAAAQEAGGDINSRGLFQCRICAMSFSMLAKLRRHVQMHTDVLPTLYTCRHCSANLENKERLSEHMQSTHMDLKQLSCLICSQIFDTDTVLYTHMQDHADARQLRSQSSMTETFDGKETVDTVGSELYEEGEGSHHATVKAEPGSPVNGYSDANDDSTATAAEIKSPHDDSVSVKQEVLALGTVLSQESSEALLGELKKIRGPRGGNKHLSCPICNKGMSSTHSLKRHVTSAHTDERPYVCCDCPKAFSRMDKFRNHLRRHFGFIYPCTVCGATFLRWYHWKKHMLIHSISCELCEFTCVNQAAMARHIAKHTGEKQFTCTYCGKQFFRNYHLQIHIRRHTGEMPYACDKCGKRFFRSDRLKRHLESHDRDCGLLCSTCGKSFTSALALKVHAHIHDAVTPQTCQLCDITLPSPKEMRKHRKEVHPGDIFLFCSVCDKQFTSHDDLIVHSSEHIDGNILPEGFVLAPDGKLVPSALASKSHEKQAFLCSICGQQLSSRHALVRHQRVHTGERNYTCQYCSHRFTTSYGLRRHVERHEMSKNGTVTKKGRKKKGAEDQGGAKLEDGTADCDDLLLESKQEYLTDFEAMQEGDMRDRTESPESNLDDVPRKVTSLPFSAEDGDGNDSNDMFDVFQPARDLSFESGRDLSRVPLSESEFQEREIKQELRGTSVDESSRSTQNSPFTSPSIPRSTAIPIGFSGRRSESYSSQFYGSSQNSASRSVLNHDSDAVSLTSHAFSGEEFRGSSSSAGRTSGAMDHTMHDRMSHPSARRSDFSSSSRSRQQMSDELLSLADASAAIERLNRSQSVLTHDLSRSGGFSMRNTTPLHQQTSSTGDLYTRAGDRDRPGPSGNSGSVLNNSDPRDILRQPLDLAKIASDVGIDTSGRFN